MELSVARSDLRLKTPLETAFGTVRERAICTVTLTDGDGVRSYGEATALEAYDGVSAERVERALGRYAGRAEKRGAGR